MQREYSHCLYTWLCKCDLSHASSQPVMSQWAEVREEAGGRQEVKGDVLSRTNLALLHWEPDWKSTLDLSLEGKL